MHLPQSHHHPDPLKSLAPHLLLHLPYSLPLLRIIQHTAFNPDARIFSTLNPNDHADPQQAWAAVYVERSRFPETECWLFSTFESWVTRRGGGSNGSTDSGRREAEGRAPMLSVLNDVAVHSSSSSLPTGVDSSSSSLPLRFLSLFLYEQRHSRQFIFRNQFLKRFTSSTTPSPTVPSHDPSAPPSSPLYPPPTQPILTPPSSTIQTLPTPNTPLILGTLNDALLPLLAGSDFPTLKPVEVLTREVVNVAVDGRPAQNGTLLPLAPSSSSSPSTTTTTNAIDANGGVILGYSGPIHKFLIPPPAPASLPAPSTTTTTSPSCLPAGYTFTTTLHHATDLALAVSRSEIPRTVAGFEKLGGVGVRFHHPSYHHHQPTTSTTAHSASPTSPPQPPAEEGGAKESELVAWLFLSPDGSLQSLHVEPEHRGKGLAKSVCRRLMERLREVPEEVGMRRLEVPQQRVGETDGRVMSDGDLAADGDDGIAAGMKAVGAEGWAHSDVLEHNADGAGVARGIGGKAGWRVRWVGVDLERVRRIWASLNA